jgi:predicted 3-demethylubiquinone-9 3-methyltransferase (glyoxalase superfamily)
MQRIVPNLWFDGTAAEAAEFYTSIFPDSELLAVEHYPTEGLLDFQRDMAGKVLTVDLSIGGYRIVGINAGPEFPINPSLSLMLNFDPSVDAQAAEHLDELWTALSDGGTALMPLGRYDFSPRYGWIQDKYGMTWQLMLTDPDGEPRPFVIPCLLFGGQAQNRGGEALDRYASIFPGARIGSRVGYPVQAGPAEPGSLMFGDIEIFGQWFALMDSSVEQDFSFTCGVSLQLNCADQDEIDRYWDLLSKVPEAEACGWCADEFGVSWQIVPAAIADYMSKPGAYGKLMTMKKLDLSAF